MCRTVRQWELAFGHIILFHRKFGPSFPDEDVTPGRCNGVDILAMQNPFVHNDRQCNISPLSLPFGLILTV
jgi:hypothetical protein